jgi:ABC-type multidrug transport system permease subunit
MRQLLRKDLLILRRSPLLVALLVIYPVVISVLIGFALSRGPDKAEIAVYNAVPESACTIDLGGEEINACRRLDELYEAIEPVEVGSRGEAIRKVEDGDVLGALVIPEDTTRTLSTGLDPAEVEVFYSAEDPVKARLVQDSIKSKAQDANNALTQRIADVAVRFLGLIVTGGEYSFLGREFDVLGLEESEQILREARRDLPPGSRPRAEVDRVLAFSELARENLDLSDDVLDTVGTPIRVNEHELSGSRSSLSSFAVAIAATISLMFITLLLAAGTLALEREENAFPRLVRGLVSKTELLLEKAALAAICSLAVCLLMLAGLSLFVDLDWDRLPLWALALAVGALAFAALGLAIGALTREVQASSLLAIMLSLPLTFLALVPSGAVAPALYDVIQVISALFPFDPALDALDAALNDSGGLAGPLLHLAGLFVAFGVLSRVGLRRFA